MTNPITLTATTTLTTITELKTPTVEQTEKHFSAMKDSVDLINLLKTKSSLTEEELDMLNRNKEHLSIMLEKDFILNDPRDKSVFIIDDK